MIVKLAFQVLILQLCQSGRLYLVLTSVANALSSPNVVTEILKYFKENQAVRRHLDRFFCFVLFCFCFYLVFIFSVQLLSFLSVLRIEKCIGGWHSQAHLVLALKSDFC